VNYHIELKQPIPLNSLLHLKNLRSKTMKTLYTSHATSIGGRQGHSETDDKQISVEMAMPGSGKQGTNPEQLLACGYSACFGSAIEAVAKKQQIKPDEIKVQADVSLNQDEKGGYSLSVALNSTISGVDDETAQKLVEQAHQICPHSKAFRGNIDIILTANGQNLAQAA
jgi:osmotically inducible protein OsmC